MGEERGAMIDRGVVLKQVRTAARQLSGLGRNLEKECARMNDGLTAIAIALAVVVVLTAAVKMPVLLDTGNGDTAQMQDED
jgi:hypothetical protein